ncbi:23S rRNA (uracil(1939)-C(5))-methyltransferase RlmD [Peptostreptococcus equinus]|uniref:23S rRNA (Uracil(1939)-C(5))-methyltransferase RlmD n=1 Tax=Peptostreptococcus equinus TaxID=3003601 RepID=A0ABY7JQD3_9FIRM|nr:23S rRNA (uracil(1939)-C(5))-methyltransferase RlmD [Peptostreptococcus sp. CBA3647]WAW14378.1 23S rRNA (uracil(1939)-C(5))-methyltransferase RlmD [Peptostreptococcus sp. CBA3647]
MKKKEIIEFEVGKMEFGGISRSIYQDKRIKMKGGITGQRVKASVKRSRSDSGEVKMMELLETSPMETGEICQHFRQCGGCSILSIPYEKQLEIKERQVKDLFDDAGLEDYEWIGIQGSPSQYSYRNKMEFTFGDAFKDGPLELGMHKVGRFIDIMTVEDCRIIDQDFVKVLVATKEYFRKKELPYYRTNDHKGYLRHLVVRKGENTKELLVNIVTSSQIDFDMTEYKDMLKGLELENGLVGILHTINDRMADVVNCDELRILDGRDYFYEEVLGLRFKVSPFSFFQTNTKGAEVLYQIARDFAGDKGDGKVVFDLYSGTGTIGQLMAKTARKVYGIEIIEEAVKAANQNAHLNGLDNCEFIAGDVVKVVTELPEKPDLIIVDPPRAGVVGNGVKDIAEFGANEIVYVSCNPKSLVENLVEFEHRGYKVEKVKLMDMFPNTPHVECIALIQRVKS